MVHAGGGGSRFHFGPVDENSQSLPLSPGGDISVADAWTGGTLTAGDKMKNG
jgi:hypothetical protein